MNYIDKVAIVVKLFNIHNGCPECYIQNLVDTLELTNDQFDFLYDVHAYHSVGCEAVDTREEDEPFNMVY